MSSDKKSDTPNWKITFEDQGQIIDKKAIAPPQGCVSITSKDLAGAKARKVENLSVKKQMALWGKAKQPAMQVVSLVVMMFFSGNSLSIFSVMIVLSALYQPLAAIAKAPQVFKKEPEYPKLDTLTPMMLYCMIYVCVFTFALYKMHTLGLLPTHLTDWAQTIPPPQPIEISATPI